MYENTEFTLSRDCEAIQIPSGQKTTIPAGTQGVITQSLGGSYTVATYQGLARVVAKFQRKTSGISSGNVMTLRFRSTSSILASSTIVD